MGKIYFAHAVNSYNTPIETAFEILIAEYLTNGDRSLIENPNQLKHQDGYNKYAQRQKESGTQHKGMSYFYDEVIEPKCGNGCVGVPFLDMRLGLGVAGEMKLNIELGRPTWIVCVKEPPTPIDLEKFIKDPSNGIFCIRHIMGMERELIRNTDPERESDLVLSHQETRLRAWKIYNREMRPFEEAHLIKMPIPAGFYPEG